MHADGKSTLASVSKWNSGKVNLLMIHLYWLHTKISNLQQNFWRKSSEIGKLMCHIWRLKSNPDKTCYHIFQALACWQAERLPTHSCQVLRTRWNTLYQETLIISSIGILWITFDTKMTFQNTLRTSWKRAIQSIPICDSLSTRSGGSARPHEPNLQTMCLYDQRLNTFESFHHYNHGHHHQELQQFWSLYCFCPK